MSLETLIYNLKSNMDRFIDDAKKEYYTVTTKFKIQYG